LKYKGGETRVVIGDRNTIREFVTVNRGTEKGGGVTTVGSDNLLMCACHVAHDCHVGSGCVISNTVLLAGHISVGDCVVLSGAVAIHHFVSVGEYAFVAGMSRIIRDVPPFLITEGDPAEARAVNVVGLRRHGFSHEALDSLEEAVKAIFRSGRPMSETLPALESQPLGPEVARLVEFLKARSAGKRGRAHQP
jgi:UDP-N-acetylglucosamine acyltransferase